MLQKEQKKSTQENKNLFSRLVSPVFGLVIAVVGILGYVYISDSALPLKTKVLYQIQWYSSSSIQYQTLELMNSTLENELTLSKFYKDSVYHQIKKQVKEAQILKMIKILTGKRSIGKSTSIRQIANQMMSKGTPVFYIQLAESYQEEGQQKSSEQIFNDKIIKSQMWSLIANWKNFKNSQTKVVRFNQIYKEKFKNKNLVLIIDEINTVSKLCQPNCSKQVQPFFKSLKRLRQRGANIILLSSDPDFTYLEQISQIRTLQEFDISWIQPKPEQDFKEMFQEYKIKDKSRQQILKYFGQRGSSIKFLQSLSSFSQNNIIKRIEKLLKQQKAFMRQRISVTDLKTKKNIFQVLMKICKQQDLQNLEDIKQYYILGAKDILFNTRFKSRMRMRAFEKYAQDKLNQAIKCKQPENIE